MPLPCLELGQTHRGVLLPVPPADADTPDHVAIRLDGNPAHEDRKAAGMHRVDAEGLVAGQGGAGGRLIGLWVARRCPAAVKALAIAISTPVMRAPVMRWRAIGWPPSSHTQMVSVTPIARAFASAAVSSTSASSRVAA